ncbi:MAG TPA: hydrogenase maturation nickel metallochaperone HypA [Rhizomicrobium sp.]|jgi:hydrogenase nickel incorporation protein HypA/HybF|nr:hydrogenase maturation nickel metallochaperone HypA [Rhizomicrobium sp.]
MHELTVAQSIVEKVDETAAGRRVCRVIVEIGRQSCVSAEALSFSFGLVAENTAIEGAVLDIRAVDGDALNLKSMEIEEAA